MFELNCGESIVDVDDQEMTNLFSSLKKLSKEAKESCENDRRGHFMISGKMHSVTEMLNKYESIILAVYTGTMDLLDYSEEFDSTICRMLDYADGFDDEDNDFIKNAFEFVEKFGKVYDDWSLLFDGYQKLKEYSLQEHYEIAVLNDLLGLIDAHLTNDLENIELKAEFVVRMIHMYSNMVDHDDLKDFEESRKKSIRETIPYLERYLESKCKDSSLLLIAVKYWMMIGEKETQFSGSDWDEYVKGHMAPKSSEPEKE